MTNETAAALAALDAKHAAARERLAQELELCHRAVVPPVRAQLTSGGLATWLHYRADTLADALAIMAAAPIVPAYAYKSTFTRVQPETLATDKSGEIVAGPFAASLKVDQGEGYGPTAVLRFYVMAGDELCHAHVRIEPAVGVRSDWQWGAAFVADGRGRVVRGRGRDAVRGDYRQNNRLSAASDHLIKWGTGGDDSASYEYFWMSDTVDGGSDHAREMLAQLAEAF